MWRYASRLVLHFHPFTVINLNPRPAVNRKITKRIHYSQRIIDWIEDDCIWSSDAVVSQISYKLHNYILCTPPAHSTKWLTIYCSIVSSIFFSTILNSWGRTKWQREFFMPPTQVDFHFRCCAVVEICCESCSISRKKFFLNGKNWKQNKKFSVFFMTGEKLHNTERAFHHDD